jgi:hypothetical protein
MGWQQCATDRVFPGGFRVRSWTEASSTVQCDVPPGGPGPVQLVEVSCTRIRWGREVWIKGAVTTPPPYCRAAFAAEQTSSQNWEWRQPLMRAPVQARSPEIVHLCAGQENISVEVQVKESSQVRRVDDGTLEITVTMC